MNSTIELIDFLQKNSDSDYRRFHAKLLPRGTLLYGVRIPVLRSLAKTLVAEENTEILRCADGTYYEIRLLRGLVAAMRKGSTEERIARICDFAATIENWAECDTVAATCKWIRRDKEKTFAAIGNLLASDKEYEVRFGVVLILCYYLDKAWLKRALDAVATVRHPGYYVKMAVAWCISKAMIESEEEALPVLEAADPEIQKMARQKLRDSYRYRGKAGKEIDKA